MAVVCLFSGENKDNSDENGACKYVNNRQTDTETDRDIEKQADIVSVCLYLSVCLYVSVCMSVSVFCVCL